MSLLKQESPGPSSKKTHLLLLDINEPGLLSLSKEIKDMEGLSPEVTTHTFKCDLSDTKAVQAVLQRAVKVTGKEGHISVVVNNAGIVHGRPLEDLRVEDFEKTLKVNATAHFAILKELLPEMMAKDDGLVVSVASFMGLFGSARLSDYCASKWAVLGMHESLRHEARAKGARNVRFLAVCPYVIDTGMFTGAFEGPGFFLALVRKLFPPLEVAAVATRVVEAMRRHEQFVVVPDYLGIVPPLIRLLPVPVQDTVLELAGCTRGMETFVGHQKAD